MTICGGTTSGRCHPSSNRRHATIDRPGEVPVGGGFTPTPDGGNEQHADPDDEDQ